MRNGIIAVGFKAALPAGLSDRFRSWFSKRSGEPVPYFIRFDFRVDRCSETSSNHPENILGWKQPRNSEKSIPYLGTKVQRSGE